MTFRTTEQAFNYWNFKSCEEIERRAQEIKALVETDENADVATLKIELDGIEMVRKNQEEKEEARSRVIDSVRIGAPSHRAYETKEYRTAFLKNLQGRELDPTERATFERAQAEYRADVPNTSSNSGAVMPTELLNEIVAKARTEGGIFAECRAFSVPANMSVPVGTPTADASWHTEGSSVDSVLLSTGSVTFNAYEILKVFQISEKVKVMSVPAFESYLTEELTKSVMGTLASSVVNGTGTNQGTGVTVASGTTSYTYDKTAGLSYSDIPKIISKLKRGYANGAKFAMNNKTLWTMVYTLTDSNNRPLFVQDLQADTVGKLLGFPVVVDDYLADETIIFGNFSYLGYNLPEGIAVTSSADSGFRSGTIDYRAMAVADTKVIVPEAFVIATRSAT